MLSFSADDAMKKKWTAFCKKINIESDFDTVLETIRLFLLPPYQAAVQGDEYTKAWVSHKQWWQ